MIELIGVHKVFGRRPAVEDLSLRVERGEIFGLLGHNGAGKSTAIGMMLGQVWPTRGEVRLFGHDVQRERGEALRRVGAIFEAPAFYEYLSGWRNLEILSRYTAPTSRRRMEEVVDWVGLSSRVRSAVRTYSHGMRARLALAQALLPGPELLILDEPGSGLDPEGIHEMRQTILRLHRELGLTLLLSSHLLTEVQQLCGRLAVLHRGRKVFEGRMAEAMESEGRVALRTPDFPGATERLKALGLITGTLDGRYVRLAEGRGTAELARALVESGMAVDGIWREERTLEDFYLELVQRQDGAGDGEGRGRSPRSRWDEEEERR